MPTKNLTIKSFLLMVLIFALTSCGLSKDPQDPYEDVNRQIFKVNIAVDKAVLRPIAKGYNKVIPQYVQARVTNFFSNFNTIATIANDILQFQVYYTFSDTSRFLVNSTLGIFGLYDVASKMELPAHDNDFGLTLAQYGMKKSPYIMIPILGPSTVRDEIGTAVDYSALSGWAVIGWQVADPYYYTYPMYGLYKLNQRAALLPTDKLVDEAFDPYVFVRDAYLQSRDNKIKQLRNIDATNGTTNGDTYVAGNGDETPAANGTASDDKDTFVPAGDTDNSQNTTETTSHTAKHTNSKHTASKTLHAKLLHNKYKTKKHHLAKNKSKKHPHLATTLEPVESTKLN